MTRHPRFQAHPLPTEREVWAFSVWEWALVAVAALVAAPLTYLFMLLALTVLDQPR